MNQEFEDKEIEQKENKNERVIFSKPVKAQPGDIYKVVSNGVTVDYTNRLSQAMSVFKDTIKPKELYKLPVEGGVICLQKVNA